MLNLQEKINQTMETLSDNQLQQVFDFILQLKNENTNNQYQDDERDIIKEIDGVLVIKASENKQSLTTEDVNQILEDLRGKY